MDDEENISANASSITTLQTSLGSYTGSTGISYGWPYTPVVTTAASITTVQTLISTSYVNDWMTPKKPDLSLVSSEELMKEVLKRGAFKTIKEYRDKK